MIQKKIDFRPGFALAFLFEDVWQKGDAFSRHKIMSTTIIIIGQVIILLAEVIWCTYWVYVY